jgi:hypothetical protein
MSSAAHVALLEHFDEMMTPTRRRALITIALGEFVDGYDLIVIGGALLALKPQWNLTVGQSACWPPSRSSARRWAPWCSVT